MVQMKVWLRIVWLRLVKLAEQVLLFFSGLLSAECPPLPHLERKKSSLTASRGQATGARALDSSRSSAVQRTNVKCRFLNGDEIDIEVNDVSTVKDLRQRAAVATRTHPDAVSIVQYNTVLQDELRLSRLKCVDAFTVVMLDHPLQWYPSGKYIYLNKDVRLIVLESWDIETDDSFKQGCRVELHFADGSFKASSGARWLQFPKEAELVRRFGFKTTVVEYKTSDAYMPNHRIKVNAVPAEDPAELVGTHSERSLLGQTDIQALQDIGITVRTVPDGFGAGRVLIEDSPSHKKQRNAYGEWLRRKYAKGKGRG